MSQEENVSNPLWPILVETVHAMIMFPHHKVFVRDVFLEEKPDSTTKLLETKLGIPCGEALVILYELTKERRKSV